jgi:mannose/fructose/sorbose-specific phosphotransferase system IID component
MSLFDALIIAILTGLAYVSRRIGGDPNLERPIVLAPIIGLLLGDLHTGLVTGGTLELIFIGAAAFGGTAPPNVAIGSAVGTGLAISSGQGVETALVVAVPAAVVGTFFELFAKGGCSFLVHRADRAAERADSRGILVTIWIGNAIHFLAYAVPTFLALYFGTDAVRSVVSALSGNVSDGLHVAGAILPAVGFGILLSVLYVRSLFPIFFLGFAAAAYAQFSVIGVTVVAVPLVLLMLSRSKQPAMVPAETSVEEPMEGSMGSMETPDERKRHIRQLMWRGFLLQGAFNYERFQNLGFWWMMRPVLERFYPEPEARALAYKRHLVYFNTNPWFVGPIAGIVAGMEKRRAAGDESVDDESITSVKVGLMAPLAGIGDSLILGTFRPVLAGVCAALAIGGNATGPVLYFVLGLAVMFLLRGYGVALGYNSGTRFFERVSPARMEQIKTAATMVGLAVAGALTASLLSVSTPLSYTNGKATIQVQDSLDQVLPSLIPLAATLFVFWLVRRRISPTYILIGAAVVGLVTGYFGVLGAG